MNQKTIFIIGIIIVVGAIGYYSFNVTDKSYVEELANERKAKDEFMKTSDDSPFGKDKNNFKGLNYFPFDDQYRVIAKLIPVDEAKMISLPTSDGTDKKYLEYAYAKFELNKKPCKLMLLEIPEGEYRGTLFLAFADSTSANETYGAGRYLDLKKTTGASTITLDFNKAYNPYCAYSDEYSCPFPPKENILPIAVRAGEKKYHE